MQKSFTIGSRYNTSSSGFSSPLFSLHLSFFFFFLTTPLQKKKKKKKKESLSVLVAIYLICIRLKICQNLRNVNEVLVFWCSGLKFCYEKFKVLRCDDFFVTKF